MRSISRLLLAVLALRLLLGLAYSALIPLGEAPDEADHYAYAAYIGREGRLPTGTAVTQAKHPPLYHALAAAAASWTGMDTSFLRSNPDGGVAAGQAPNFFVHTGAEAWPWRDGPLAMHLGRLVSVLAGLALVLATYGLGRAIWPDWPVAALAGAALAAFIPESLFIGAAMSNDMLAAALATLALWAGVRRGGRRYANALLCGACAGLAFLAKVSAVAVAPVAFAGLWLSPGEDRNRARQGDLANGSASGRTEGLANGKVPGTSRIAEYARRFAAVAIAGAAAAATAAPWLWRNWRLYGDPLGWPVVLGTIDRRTSSLGLADLWWLARGWFFSFWGKFGGAGQLPLPAAAYALWLGLLVAAAAGWLRTLVSSRGRSAAGTRASRWLVLLGAPALVVLSMISYSQVALGTDQGRLLYPALAPIALLIGGGIAAWWPRRGAGLAPAAWSAGLAAVAVAALLAGIVQPYAPPRPQPAEAAAAAPLGRAFASQISLVSWAWDGPAARLTLYWQAVGPIHDDLRTAVRLVDGGGNLLWEWKRSPGEGRYSTDRWRAGQVLGDEYALPADKVSQAAQLEVGVYVFATGAWLEPEGPAPASPFVVLAAGAGMK